MKRILIRLTPIYLTMLAMTLLANPQDPAGQGPGDGKERHRHWRGDRLEHMTKTLDLTPEQQSRIRPILDQAKPEMEAIRKESRQKMKAIRDNVRLQIRPLLTPAQQEKMDAMQKARENVRKAREEVRAAATK